MKLYTIITFFFFNQTFKNHARANNGHQITKQKKKKKKKKKKKEKKKTASHMVCSNVSVVKILHACLSRTVCSTVSVVKIQHACFNPFGNLHTQSHVHFLVQTFELRVSNTDQQLKVSGVRRFVHRGQGQIRILQF